MKILLLSDSLTKGGKERRMIELIKGLLKNPNIHVELVLFKNSIDYPEIFSLGISLHIIERRPKHNPKTFLTLYRICKELRPDIIHTWSNMTAIFAYPAIKLLNIKLLNGNIASAPKNLNIWDKDLLLSKLTYTFSDIVVGNSRAGLQAFKAPVHKSRCVPNGFDFQRLNSVGNAKEIRSKYQVSECFIIGMIAIFADRKDYETYVTAATRVLKHRNNVKFFAIGAGPNLDKVKSMVPDALKEHILFTGNLSNVEALINVFDIGVLLTNNEVHGEGISNSIMEYMALGKPVIATEGGGTNEIVLDKVTGFLVPPKSPDVLCIKIHELLDNANKAKRMGQEGLERVREHYNIDKMISMYSNLYSELLN